MAELTREQVEQIVKEAQEKGERPDLRKVDLSEADLFGANLSEANLRRADLSEANLRRADLSEANLSEANLSETYPGRAYLGGANLSEADLRGANLNKADLSEADLFGANLIETYLSGANLGGANLSEANLSGANLGGANLSEANLSEADLFGADLSEANLIGADLSEADLSEADLSGAKLIGANLSEAKVGHTSFGDVDLTVVKGLDTVKHRGPSTIGTDTLQLSKGQIPEVFLRGCGLSDVQIEYAKLHNPDLTAEQVTVITYKIHELLVEKAIHYYSCFISYSHHDEAFARRLHDNLQENGVRCWFAPEQMKIGDKIRDTITDSIRLHDKLLLILSEHSIKSDWVEMEVERAFGEERKRKQTVLFPIRLDEMVMECDQPWVEDIRLTRHIGDFCGWQDQGRFQQGFKRLLRDLQMGEETPPTLPPRFAQRMRDDTADSLRRQLARHRSNLNKLEEDAAIYGAGEVPLRLQNQIEDEQQAIEELETELAEVEGEQES